MGCIADSRNHGPITGHAGDNQEMELPNSTVSEKLAETAPRCFDEAGSRAAGGGGVGTRPWCQFVCLWRRLLAYWRGGGGQGSLRCMHTQKPNGPSRHLCSSLGMDTPGMLLAAPPLVAPPFCMSHAPRLLLASPAFLGPLNARGTGAFVGTAGGAVSSFSVLDGRPGKRGRGAQLSPGSPGSVKRVNRNRNRHGGGGGGADTQMAHDATFSTVPRHQLLRSANAETTPARASAAVVDRK